MATSPATTVVASFKLMPGRQAQWEEVYTKIMQRAEQDPTSGLRHVRLMRDVRDEKHFVIVGEWDSPGAFDRFVRDSGLMWESRGLGYAATPINVTYLEAVSDGV